MILVSLVQVSTFFFYVRYFCYLRSFSWAYCKEFNSKKYNIARW